MQIGQEQSRAWKGQKSLNLSMNISEKCFPANTLPKFNVILWLYFGNLSKLLSASVDVT